MTDALHPRQVWERGSLQGGRLRRHVLTVRRYPRISVDHALLMAATYAKEKANDINGRKTLHNS
jgi:hypothetical protein